MFSVYCGLALHHAKLYDKIRRSEQKYKGNKTYFYAFNIVLISKFLIYYFFRFFFKVALEVLSYHNASSANEVDDLVTEGAQDCDEKVARYVVCKEFCTTFCFVYTLYLFFSSMYISNVIKI